MKVLAVGLDSLTLGLYYRDGIRPQLLSDLARLTDDLANAPHGERAAFLVGEQVVDVGFGGSGWSWRLECPDRWDVVLREKRRSDRDPAPTAMVRIFARELWAAGWEQAAAAWLEGFAPAIGQGLERVIVSRADLAVDWTGWVPERDQLDDFVRRSRHAVATFQRRQYGVGDEDEAWERGWHVDRAFTGWSFGKSGPLLARIYDKTAELRVSRKDWFEEVWQRNADEAGRAVWRCEFQCRREALKALGLDRLEDARRQLPRVWAALAGCLRTDPKAEAAWERSRLLAWADGKPEPPAPEARECGWLTLREHGTGDRPEKWPIHSEWRQLQEAGRVGFGSPALVHPAVRDHVRTMDADQTLTAVTRGLARLVALHGLQRPPEPCVECESQGRPWSRDCRGCPTDYRAAADDPMAAAYWLGHSGILARELRRKGIAWEELVGEFRDRLPAAD